MRHDKLEIADTFHRDLDRAAYYISDVLQNKRAAYRLTVKVKETLMNLQEMASGYPLVRNDILAEKGFRWVSVYNYVIFFIVDDEHGIVKVYRFLYKHQDWGSILG